MLDSREALSALSVVVVTVLSCVEVSACACDVVSAPSWVVEKSPSPVVVAPASADLRRNVPGELADVVSARRLVEVTAVDIGRG